MTHIPRTLLAACTALALVTPALAAGDATKGENEFKKCRSCHSITKPDGTDVVKGGKIGPNLYGVIGRTAGSTDFAYSDLMKEAGTKGLVWDEAELVPYLADPAAFLRGKASEATGSSKMSFKLAKGGEDIAAYLASVAQK